MATKWYVETVTKERPLGNVHLTVLLAVLSL